MRTNIDLDERLVAEAFKHTTVSTKKELVHLALEEFVQNRSRKDVRDLKGKIAFADGYDHKKLRRGETE